MNCCAQFKTEAQRYCVVKNALLHAVLFIYRAVWYCPLLFCVVTWTYYFMAWNALGHPPVPDLNDPKALPFGFMHELVGLALIAGMSGLLYGFGMFILLGFTRKLPVKFVDVAAYLIGAMFMLWTLFPADVMEWYFD